MNEKNKIEAVLFSTGRRTSIEEISRMSGISDIELIKNALNELKAEYELRGSSLSLFEDAGKWKLNVKEHYQPIVQKIVSQTELDRPLMETLAVIAWKYPVVQSDVIKIRHNKAYEHLRRLEEEGFVTRQQFGRTRKITLSEKFFEYFDLPTKEQSKELFKQQVPAEVQQSIEKTEQEIDDGEKRIFDARQKEKEMRKEKKKKRKEKEDGKTSEEKMQETEETERIEKTEEIAENIEEIKETEQKIGRAEEQAERLN